MGLISRELKRNTRSKTCGISCQYSKMSDIEINGTPVTKLRVVDLKNELDARGLSKSGKKDELIARLISYIEVEEASKSSEPKVLEEKSDEESSEMTTKAETNEECVKDKSTAIDNSKTDAEGECSKEEPQIQTEVSEEKQIKAAEDESKKEQIRKLAEEEAEKEKAEREERKKKDDEERERLKKREKKKKKKKKKK